MYLRYGNRNEADPRLHQRLCSAMQCRFCPAACRPDALGDYTAAAVGDMIVCHFAPRIICTFSRTIRRQHPSTSIAYIFPRLISEGRLQSRKLISSFIGNWVYS